MGARSRMALRTSVSCPVHASVRSICLWLGLCDTLTPRFCLHSSPPLPKGFCNFLSAQIKKRKNITQKSKSFYCTLRSSLSSSFLSLSLSFRFRFVSAFAVFLLILHAQNFCDLWGAKIKKKKEQQRDKLSHSRRQLGATHWPHDPAKNMGREGKDCLSKEEGKVRCVWTELRACCDWVPWVNFQGS